MAEVTIKQNTPRGWLTGELGDFLADIGDGGTPSRSKSEYFGGEIPWVVVNDIKPHIKETKDTLTNEGLKRSSAKLWPTGSVILSFGATIGEVGIADVPVTTKQGIAGLIPKTNLLNTYLYYLLLNNKSRLHKLSSGSTIKEVRPSVIKSQIDVLIPPIKEQQKIAEILGTVDEEIAKTKEVIEATEKLKRGLMRESVGKTGDELRLGDICVVDWGNTELTKKAYVGNGKYLAVSAAGPDGRIDYAEHKAGTPVLSAIGANCGKMFLPVEDFTAIKNTITFEPIKDRGDGKFIYYLLTSSDIPKRGGAQPFISKGDLQSLKVRVPKDVKDQQRIAGILSSIDEKISVNKKLKEKLALLKKGLMQDLLSGRVRTNI